MERAPPVTSAADLDSSSVTSISKVWGRSIQYWFPGIPHRREQLYRLFQVNDVGRLSACSSSLKACRLLTRNGRNRRIANFAVDPVNGSDIVISSNTGNIFSTTNGGETWFDIGDPAVFRQSRATTASPWPTGRPTPTRPRASATWATSFTSAPSTGQIYITQDRRRTSGTSNDWI